MTDKPSPSDLLGIPGLDSWYPMQYELMDQALDWYDSDSRFLGEAVPVGQGKSVSSVLLSRMTGARTVILTASKGLQRQYLDTFAPLGMAEVKGQQNFQCLLSHNLRADEGPCHDGMACPVRESCPYRVQLRRAQESDLVVTNYAYWLAQTNFSMGLGDVGLLVLDESHLAFAAMENYLTIFIAKSELQPCGIDFPQDVDFWPSWLVWAEASLPGIRSIQSQIESDVRQYTSRNQTAPTGLLKSSRSVKSLINKLDRLSKVEEEWVIQRTKYGYRFTPKWVSNYSDHLFHNIPKVVLMSAVLSHKTLDCLGVPSNGNRSWVETESHFPPSNGPIYHVSTARINSRTDDFGATIWVSRIDQIIQRRLDRKGIVFPVSYERAKLLLSRSRFKDIMLAHGTSDVVEVVEKYKRSDPPVVLVSPTVTTGWDFPMGDGMPQYGIVGKLPYPDTRDPVTKARSGDDKEWTSYMAMEVLAQTVGRLNRSPDDLSEMLVIDDNMKWFAYRYKQFAPSWFMERYKGTLDTVPDPLV